MMGSTVRLHRAMAIACGLAMAGWFSAVRWCGGQELRIANATLQPSGEVRRLGVYTFQVEPAPVALLRHAPYSAEEVERSASLAYPGTLEEQEHWLRRIARDSSGRTRIERPWQIGPGSAKTLTVVQIFDARSGFGYVLDAQMKVAHRYRMIDAGVPRPEAVRKVPVATMTAESGQKTRTVAAASSDRTHAPEALAVEGPKTATLPGSAGRVESEDLGQKELEGLLVQGIRYLVPTGAEDGVPRVMTTEVWTSPELGITVETRSENQQASDRLVHLIHLTRAEPDPSLFEVPAGYRIQDETSEFQVGVSF